MNIKAMRNIHLYLGCFFAPLLILFVITGCWQTFNLHEASKKSGGYQPPQIVKTLSQIHIDQSLGDHKKDLKPSWIFRYLIVLMSIGLSVTTVLGIVLAFKYAPSRNVWGCLLGGVFIPIFLLFMARF